MSLIFISILLLSQMLLSIQKLEFSKKRNFYFGDGEYGKIKLQVKNSETYNYQSEIKKPFVLKKGSNGTIELIYDVRLVDDDEKEIDKVYKTSFTFVKKNIGKKERIYISARYKPEIQIVENDTLYSTYTEVELSPDNPSQVVLLNSVKKYYSKFKADYDKNLIGILSDTDLKFSKGINTLEISLARSENFEQEIMLYRPVGKSKINQLYITVKSSGFETAVADEEPVEDDSMLDSAEVSLTEGDEYDTDEYIVSDADGLDETEESSSGFSFISIIIMGVMGIIILILIVLLLVGKKGGLYEKYETFFDDVASIVNIEAKGNNMDKVIEEIMMILLDKFETQYGKEQEIEEPEKKPAPETKTINTIKTPSLGKPTPEPADEDIDLDFGKSDDKPKEEEDKKLKLDSGFDFSDDKEDKEDIK